MGRLSRSGTGKDTPGGPGEGRQALEKAGMWEASPQAHRETVRGPKQRVFIARALATDLKFCSWMSRRQAWTRNPRQSI